jgi:hypothetical protein
MMTVSAVAKLIPSPPALQHKIKNKQSINQSIINNMDWRNQTNTKVWKIPNKWM